MNKGKITTEELIQELKDAQKLNNWKNALKGNSKGVCSNEVRDYLDQNLPSWRDDQKPTKKSMEKAPKPNPVKTPKENPEEKRKQRIQSELSNLHQKYKTMNSANLHKTFQEDPQLWHVYHQISEQNEQSFPEDEIPYRRIIQYLETLRQHSAVVADLGCGKAKIHKHFALTNKFQFHNFDHVACHDSVVSRDISNTELPNASVDIVILCLAMWGSNCEAYLEEAYRILDKGGRLLIMEPSKRWIEEETGKNRLEEWLQKRFTLAKKEERKFMFLEAFKIN